MGQAKRRGTFEERKAKAISVGRKPGAPRKSKFASFQGLKALVTGKEK
jgi:hypothetical protein